MKRKYPDAWIMTASGRRFWPIEPSADDVHLGDICTALSRICRFAGHVQQTVAEHTLEMTEMAAGAAQRDGFSAVPLVRLKALLHDLPEAYVQDLPGPLKQVLPEYQAMEGRVYSAIVQALAQGMRAKYTKAVIARADEYVRAADRAHLAITSWQEWSGVPGADARWREVGLGVPKEALIHFGRDIEALTREMAGADQAAWASRLEREVVSASSILKGARL